MLMYFAETHALTKWIESQKAQITEVMDLGKYNNDNNKIRLPRLKHPDIRNPFTQVINTIFQRRCIHQTPEAQSNIAKNRNVEFRLYDSN